MNSFTNNGSFPAKYLKSSSVWHHVCTQQHPELVQLVCFSIFKVKIACIVRFNSCSRSFMVIWWKGYLFEALYLNSIGTFLEGREMVLGYRASRDGFSALRFHERWAVISISSIFVSVFIYWPYGMRAYAFYMGDFLASCQTEQPLLFCWYTDNPEDSQIKWVYRWCDMMPLMKIDSGATMIVLWLRFVLIWILPTTISSPILAFGHFLLCCCQLLQTPLDNEKIWV